MRSEPDGDHLAAEQNNVVRDGKEPPMGYGIGGILVLILVILAIIYFAKRV